MTIALPAPPCWADLWTSDVEGSRRFYSELFGWKAGDPSPEFGGYFMFSAHDGAPVCGAMGDMGEIKANNTWKVYFAVDDADKTVRLAEEAGAHVLVAPSPVADLGAQAVLGDPTGAVVGLWQPGDFGGFSVLEEPGAPSWFELLTRDYTGAIEFYRNVLECEPTIQSDTADFRYTTLKPRGGGDEVAGIMDASRYLPPGAPTSWTVYWAVEDVDITVAKARELGGSVTQEPEATPYGRLAGLADPSGAHFKLRQP